MGRIATATAWAAAAFSWQTFAGKILAIDSREFVSVCLRKRKHRVRDGDTLHVHSMDRRARNLDDLRRMVKELTGRGVIVRFHKEGLTFTGDDSPMATLLPSMLGAVAEFERSLIAERRQEGITVAKAKGDVYKGRKPSLSEEKAEELRKRAANGDNKAALAREFGISRAPISKTEQAGKAQGAGRCDQPPPGSRRPRAMT